MDTQNVVETKIDLQLQPDSANSVTQVESLLFVDGVEVTNKTWKRVFIKELMGHGIFAVAAQRVGRRPSEVRKEAATDQVFNEFIQDAMEVAAGVLEQSARKRAIAESDTLMIRLLEATQPERFRRDAPPSGTTFIKAYMGFTPDMWDDDTGKQKVESNPPSEQLAIDVSVDVTKGNPPDGTTDSTI